MFIFERERKRDREYRQGRDRARGTEDLKRTPC